MLCVLARGSGSEGVGFGDLGGRNRGKFSFVTGGAAVVVIEAEHGDDTQGSSDSEGTEDTRSHESEEGNCGGDGEEDEGCFHDVSYFEVLLVKIRFLLMQSACQRVPKFLNYISINILKFYIIPPLDPAHPFFTPLGRRNPIFGTPVIWITQEQRLPWEV